ncbi:hypothetical protein JCM33374_g6254 [Metschnikowia sp. JCM 33374]|nr:hypothetical protein JCM33374_g6254 [Metschnikowia sp. JCM 33374]
MGKRLNERSKANDKETIFFEPKQQPGKKTSVLVKVAYNKEEDVQRYFRWNFLTFQDTVESWRVQKEVKNSNHKYTSHVWLILGQQTLPPKTPSSVYWTEYVEDIQKQLRFVMQWMCNIEESMKRPAPKGKDKESRNAQLQETLDELQPEKDRICLEFMDIVKCRPKPSVQTQYSMVCEVLKAPNYCHLCRTVSHPFSQCEARGCTVCGSKMHPYYKCIKRCECKTKPLHMKEKCPRNTATIGPSRKAESLRKIQKSQNNTLAF